MSKILAVSDVHIHDYPQRNPSEKFRLYQSKVVAENIIKVGRQEGADIIVFAGDVLEKTINRPYVQAEVKQFLDKIMQNFREGYIIWGNHDQDNKSIFSDLPDLIEIFIIKNMKRITNKICYLLIPAYLLCFLITYTMLIVGK